MSLYPHSYGQTTASCYLPLEQFAAAPSCFRSCARTDQSTAHRAWLHSDEVILRIAPIWWSLCVCLQTGRSQLRRYKSKKSLVSEGEATSEQNKPKSQILEFWLVREYCDKGSLMVRSPSPPPPSFCLPPCFFILSGVTGAQDDFHCRLFARSAGA